jgi:hypothetical protein
MLVTPLPIVKLVRLVQPENADSPMLVTPLGMVMLLKPLLSNAESPILVTLLGIVTLVSPVQPSNASSPTLVMPLGRVTPVRLVQFQKA